jgi:predicted nuclease of restriction endonuclease-like (RecB) superfamily
MREKISNNNTSLISDKDYKKLLIEIKTKLTSARLKAAITVNSELINFYWEVGKLILVEQEKAKWGDKLFDNLAADLSKNTEGNTGFSKTNLKNMRNFVLNYPHAEFRQALPDQLTWTHHVVLLNIEELDKRQWYATQVIEHNWSYRQLKDQIQSSLYERQSTLAVKTTNFTNKLPAPQSSLAQELIKDPYKFHFLNVPEDAHEKEIQKGLMDHVRHFLMEIGQGFALYGVNYPVYVSDKRFEIDLLMYNTKLHCYVVVEIKRGEFKPENTGQLNFYLSAIDANLKTPQDQPTIGLLLCEYKDKIIAEYALNRVTSPMGISQYELSKSLPKKLQSILPTTAEIEAELSKNTYNE